MKTVFKRFSDEGIFAALKNSTVFKFFICNLLYTINLWMTIAYYPVYFNKLGISDNRIGILISVISFATLVLVFPFGVLSDRTLPKTLLRIGAFLLAISNILIVFNNDFYFLLTVVTVGGIGSSLFVITLYSLFFKQLSDVRRGVRISLFTFGAALGFGIGPFIGGFIIKYNDISNVFVLTGILNFVLFFLVSTLKSSQPIKFRLNMYKEDIFKPKVLFVIIVVFVTSSHFGVEKTCLSLFMTKNIGLSSVKVGTIFMCVGVWIAILNLVAGHSFDKTQKLTLLVALSILVSGFFQTFTAFATSFTEILSIRLAHTIGDAFFLVLRAIMITTIFPNDRMGGNFGFIYAVNTAAITVTSLICGNLNSRYGYGIPFMANGILVMLMAITMLFFTKRIRGMLESR